MVVVSRELPATEGKGMARTESGESDPDEKPKKRFCCCFPKRSKVVQKERSVLIGPCGDQASKHLQNVPFHGRLPKILQTEDVICITGFTQARCVRFSVNLTCGEGPTADIAFHFNPRLDRNYVVRNCRLGGRWGEEETASIVKCDIVRNKAFRLDVFVAKNEFMVSINGRHFCSFGVRVALDLISHLEVHGDVDIPNIEYKKWNGYPQHLIEGAPFEIPMGEQVGDQTDHDSREMTIPCTGHLPKGFQEGWQLEIYGRVKLLPHSFYINLQDGAQLWPHPIIPLHLNPRFNVSVGENVFVCNDWRGGKWGQEERTPGFQFSPGAPFSMAIQRGDGQFSIWVDGQLIGEFRFRGPVDEINTIYIQGDVIIKQVVMHDRLIDMYKKN